MELNVPVTRLFLRQYEKLRKLSPSYLNYLLTDNIDGHVDVESGILDAVRSIEELTDLELACHILDDASILATGGEAMFDECPKTVEEFREHVGDWEDELGRELFRKAGEAALRLEVRSARALVRSAYKASAKNDE